MGTVCFVHAVDTEGPLFEDLEATFWRLKDRFGVDLEPSRETLEQLRRKEIDLGGREEAVTRQVQPEQLDRFLGTWDRIDRENETIMDEAWRRGLSDSTGEPYVISWFCLDHVHYNNNPRRRAMGFHAVFDYYRQALRDYKVPRDRLYFHYHPPAPSGDAHCMGRGFALPYQVQDEILARRIIDRRWFPVAFRPGGCHEAYDVNVWLEAWIPFDLANQNKSHDPEWAELIDGGVLPGQVSDWRGAPTDWRLYHPDLHDFRQPGNLRRWVGRCLNMFGRHSLITEEEIEAAFCEAENGPDVFVSATNHDFRSMIKEIEEYVALVRKVAARHRGVSFRWTNAIEGFRRVADLPRLGPPSVEVELNDKAMVVETERPIWGSQPFVAMRTRDGRYFRQNMLLDSKTRWGSQFDSETTALDTLSHIGIGFNDDVGNTVVAVCDLLTQDGFQVTTWNTDDWLS